MLLFGMVDVCLLSVFLITSTFVLQIAFMDILIQFILPMNVTCCICFRLLCSKEDDYVSSTLFSCLIWIAVWTLVVLKDSIYEHISTSIWCGMMILSVLYLCYSIWRVWKCSERYYEKLHNGRNQRNVRNLIMELELKKLTKEFQGFKAVDDITLTMSNGVYGLLGVNGAGKTTLMRMLCTLIKPTSGSILCDGKDIFALDGEYRRILGYLPQEFGFYKEFTVSEIMEYICIMRDFDKKTIGETLEKVNLYNERKKKYKELSETAGRACSSYTW